MIIRGPGVERVVDYRGSQVFNIVDAKGGHRCSAKLITGVPSVQGSGLWEFLVI